MVRRGEGTKMAQSQNSSVYYTEHATSFHGLATYGNVMLGNKAFEFYNERNPEDYIQIPWSEIDRVAASVMFGGKEDRALRHLRQGQRSGFLVLDARQQGDAPGHARACPGGEIAAFFELL